MRDTSRWHLTDVQRILLMILVVVALFLSAMAWGMESIVLLLIAVLLLVTAGLAVFLLGLRYSGVGGERGAAHVIAVPPPPANKIVGRCDLRLLVELPGRPSVMMKVRDPSVPVIKWPYVGMTLPVEVPPDHPRKLRIRWEIVPDLQSRSTDGGDLTAPGPAEVLETMAPSPRDYDNYYLEDSPTPPAPPQPGRYRHADDEIINGYIVEPDDPILALAAGRDLPARVIPHPRGEATDPGPLEEPGVDVVVYVSDLAASRSFYQDVLGLRLVESADGTAVFSHGESRIVLRTKADMSPVAQRPVHVHLRVADIDASFRELRGKGAPYAHRPRLMSRNDEHEVWIAMFHDPDGHAIGLIEWRDRGSPQRPAQVQDVSPDQAEDDADHGERPVQD